MNTNNTTNTTQTNEEKMNEVKDRVEDKLVNQADKFSKNPVKQTFKVALIILAIVVGLSVVGGTLGFIGGWFNKAAEVAGPANVSSQYKAVINDYKAMEAAAMNACNIVNTKSEDADPMLVEDPAFAYNAQYRRIAVDYNTRQNNIFQAKLVGPKGYPRNAPSLEAMKAKVC